MGINRNIVECKYSSHDGFTGLHIGINRNIVECKFRNASIPPATSSVLIETLWNVNNLETTFPVTSSRY